MTKRVKVFIFHVWQILHETHTYYILLLLNHVSNQTPCDKAVKHVIDNWIADDILHEEHLCVWLPCRKQLKISHKESNDPLPNKFLHLHKMEYAQFECINFTADNPARCK